MQSKTSYFNKTIFLKNITRFWPIWSAYLLVCMVRLPLRLFYALELKPLNRSDLSLEAYRLLQLQEVVKSALKPLPFFLFAAITAIAVFSYLYQARSCHMMHAFPVCRESLFLSNLFSGVCFLALPQAVAFMGGIVVCFLKSMLQLEYLMHWLLLSLGISCFALSLAVFAVMIAGNIVAAPVFYFILNFLFVGCRTVVFSLIDLMSYGICSTESTFGNFLSPYYYLTNHFFASSFYAPNPKSRFQITEMYGCVAAYFGAGLLILVLTFFIYKKKHLETAGDPVTIPFLKPIFRWILAFSIGIYGTIAGQYFLKGSYYSGGKLLLLLFFMSCIGALAFFASDMLLQKKFFVFRKKRLLECGVFLALSWCFFLAVDWNLFGIETQIPREEEIQSVFLSGIYPIHAREEDYSNIIEIHEKLVESREEIQQYFRKYSENSYASSLDITYTLKNGRTLTRSYFIPIEDFYLSQEGYPFCLLEQLSDQPEYYLSYHFTENYDSLLFVNGSMDVFRGSEYLESTSLNQEQCTRIFQSLKQDILEGNYHIYDYSRENKVSDLVYYNTLHLTFQVPMGTPYVYYGGMDTVDNDSVLQATSISLTTDCVHTLQAFRDLGILDPEENLITQQEADLLYSDDYPEAQVYR